MCDMFLVVDGYHEIIQRIYIVCHFIWNALYSVRTSEKWIVVFDVMNCVQLICVGLLKLQVIIQHVAPSWCVRFMLLWLYFKTSPIIYLMKKTCLDYKTTLIGHHFWVTLLMFCLSEGFQAGWHLASCIYFLRGVFELDVNGPQKTSARVFREFGELYLFVVSIKTLREFGELYLLAVSIKTLMKCLDKQIPIQELQRNFRHSVTLSSIILYDYPVKFHCIWQIKQMVFSVIHMVLTDFHSLPVSFVILQYAGFITFIVLTHYTAIPRLHEIWWRRGLWKSHSME